jgi:SAM domain (Sterile alpha motif)
MQQMADWLEELGMSEYAERFAEKRIDLSVLPDLTDQHLEKLGVALGDRLKVYGRSESFPPPPWPLNLPHLSCKIAPSDASSR